MAWKRRVRSSFALKPDGTRAGDHDVWRISSIGGGERTSPPRKVHGRMARSRKRKPLDLAASLGNGMFGPIVVQQPDSPHDGVAFLCFLTDSTFVGLVRLTEGQPDAGTLAKVVRLSGAEAAGECDRELCGADDCCGDVAFALRAVDPSRVGARRFVARSIGLGDYAAFEGRGVRFQTERVLTGAARELALLEHFAELPEPACDDAVLCEGPMTLEWDKLFDFPSGDARAPRIADYPSGDARAKHAERGEQPTPDPTGLVAAIETVAVPRPRAINIADLVAAGGTPLDISADDDDDNW